MYKQVIGIMRAIYKLKRPVYGNPATQIISPELLMLLSFEDHRYDWKRVTKQLLIKRPQVGDQKQKTYYSGRRK